MNKYCIGVNLTKKGASIICSINSVPKDGTFQEEGAEQRWNALKRVARRSLIQLRLRFRLNIMCVIRHLSLIIL